MRRHITYILMAMLTVVSIHAEHITSSEALSLVSKCTKYRAAKARNFSNYQLVYVADECYVFNNSNGFLVLAADDCVSDLVLGYSDNGTFDYASMPDAMKEWLTEMNDEVAQLVAIRSKYPNRVSSSLDVLEPIEPLTKTLWNQSAPYNNMAPTNSDGAHYAAGCVPVAMAQVMAFHKWPEHGTGSNSYSWDMDGTKTTLSMDFSESTYDWANICDTYDNISTDDQNNAVAKLMLDCGVSVNAEYRAANTTANSDNVAYVLVDYFGYDKSMTYVQRNFYTKKEWRDLLYNNLSAGLPIYYRGTSNDGGHAFVCDGYKDGLFHINWGWGGMSNGYFQIALLEPAEQGIGGSTSGYQRNQKAILGIKPEAGGDAAHFMYCNSDFTTTATSVTKSDAVTFAGDCENRSCVAAVFTLGIKIVDAAGNYQYVKSTNLVNKYLGRGGTFAKMKVSMSDAELSEGTYTITPAYYDKANDRWDEMRVLKSASKPYIFATVDADGNITFSYPASDTVISATSLAPRTRVIVGYDTDIDFTIACTEGEYLNNVTVAFLESGTTNKVKESSNVFIDLANGEDYSYNTSISNPDSASTYDLVLLDANGNIVSERVPVTVENAPEGDLTVKGKLTVPGTAVDNLLFNLNLQCTSGVFNNKITIFIYDSQMATSATASIPGKSRTFLVAGDDAIDVSFSGALDLTVGKTYFAYAYFTNPGWVKIATKAFRTTASTGIEEINQDEIENLPTYNLQGQKVNRFDKGLLIKNGKKFINK